MYNGIGLSTVRGTATSGHVQRNASHVHASRRRTQTSRHVAGHRTGPQLVSAAAQSRGNREIQDHADRRRLENRLLVLREEWEARGVAEAEIVARLATERAASVASRNESAEAAESVVLSPDTRSSVRSGVPGHLTRACRRDAVATTNTHVQKQAKAVENERLAAAFGISHVRHQEGAAFDRELQQAKKQERLARLEEERRVIEKAARKREKELRKAQKEAQRKQAKRKDDDSLGVGVVAESARTVEAAAAQSAGLRRDENERGRFLQSLRKKRKRNDQFLQRADLRCHRHIGLNADRDLHLGHRHRNDLEAGQRHILEAHRVRDLVRLHGLDPDHDCEILETDPEVDHIRDPHPVLVPDHREDGPELGRAARVFPRTFHEKWRPKIGGLLPGVPYLLAPAGPDTRPALPPIRPDRTVVARPVDHREVVRTVVPQAARASTLGNAHIAGLLLRAVAVGVEANGGMRIIY